MPRRLIVRIAWSPAARSSAAIASTSRPDRSPRLPAFSSSRRSTTSTTGRAPARPRAAGRPGDSGPRAPGRRDSTDGVALPRTTAAPASSAEARSPCRGPGGAASGRTCRRRRAPRRRRRARHRPAARVTASRVPTTTSTSPLRIRRHSSARSPSAEPRVDEGDPHVEVGPEPVHERQGEHDLRDERRGPAGRVRGRRRSRRRRSRSCRCR